MSEALVPADIGELSTEASCKAHFFALYKPLLVLAILVVEDKEGPESHLRRCLAHCIATKATWPYSIMRRTRRLSGKSRLCKLYEKQTVEVPNPSKAPETRLIRGFPSEIA